MLCLLLAAEIRHWFCAAQICQEECDVLVHESSWQLCWLAARNIMAVFEYIRPVL